MYVSWPLRITESDWAVIFLFLSFLLGKENNFNSVGVVPQANIFRETELSNDIGGMW